MIINISYPRKSLCNLRLPSIMHGPVCPRKHRKLQNCRLKPSQVSTVNRFYWEEVCVIDEPVWIKMPGEKNTLFHWIAGKTFRIFSTMCLQGHTHGSIYLCASEQPWEAGIWLFSVCLTSWVGAIWLWWDSVVLLPHQGAAHRGGYLVR